MATAGLPSELPTSTSEAIFGKEARGDNDQQKNKEEEIAPKEFFWDQFLKYLATGVALLTLLDLTVQFFQGGNLFCYPPSGYQNETLDVTARDQAAYINAFCLQSLTRAEFYAVFIIIEGIFLIAPHYLWTSLFGGQFDFFFAIVRQIDRLRDSNTGEYRQKNFDLVKRLEKEFPETLKWNGIVFMYRFKLFAQCVVTFVSIIINGAVFPPHTFDFVFPCPSTGFANNTRLGSNSTEEVPEGWGFPFSVQCVYSSFRVLSKIWYANFILLFAALLMASYGLLWTFKRHTSALGHKVIAKFAYTSCLSPDEYVFKQFLKSPIKPRIVTDLDFLLLRLFRADSGHGQVFKDILTDKELKRLINEDHERLHLYLNAIRDQYNISLLQQRSEGYVDEGQQTSGHVVIDAPADPARASKERKLDIQSVYFQSDFNVTLNPEKLVYEEELGTSMLGNVRWEDVKGIRDLLIKFCAFAPDKCNHRAYDISFGTIGYSLVLARAFKSVISVNFHPFFRNTEKKAKKEKFHSSITKITFHDDILSQQSDSINECDEMVDEEFDLDEEEDLPVLKQQINLIVVGPFMGEARKATVTLHIERLYNGKYFSRDALLLAVRPLKIGHEVVADHYCKYEPAEGLFGGLTKEENDKVTDAERQGHITFDYVLATVVDVKTRKTSTKKIWGIKVVCFDRSTQLNIECIFEFVPYRFKNIYFSQPSHQGTEEPQQTPEDIGPREAPRRRSQKQDGRVLLPQGKPTLGTSPASAENGPTPARAPMPHPMPRPLPPNNESPCATVMIQLSAQGSDAPVRFILNQNTDREEHRASNTEPRASHPRPSPKNLRRRQLQAASSPALTMSTSVVGTTNQCHTRENASASDLAREQTIGSDSLQQAERSSNGVHSSYPSLVSGVI